MHRGGLIHSITYKCRWNPVLSLELHYQLLNLEVGMVIFSNLVRYILTRPKLWNRSVQDISNKCFLEGAKYYNRY